MKFDIMTGFLVLFFFVGVIVLTDQPPVYSNPTERVRIEPFDSADILKLRQHVDEMVYEIKETYVKAARVVEKNEILARDNALLKKKVVILAKEIDHINTELDSVIYYKKSTKKRNAKN